MVTDRIKFVQIIAATFVAAVLIDGVALSADRKVQRGADVRKEVNDPAFREGLLAIAAEYKNYGKVDDWARWAPRRCALSPPPKARLSASKDPSTHGNKVYFLYAKNRDQYFQKETPQIGQVIVKESWYPAADGTGNPAASEKKLGLFIMMKLDPQSRDTDHGWVYATVSPDGNNVMSAGRVQSCMECHVTAKNDRLFGLAP
jgi:hypothetical protein